MENRIKEQQLDLFADRASCHAWWPNQYRLPLSALAYTLLEAVRRIALVGSELANAHVGTIRLKLLKIWRRGVAQHPRNPCRSPVPVRARRCSTTPPPGSSPK